MGEQFGIMDIAAALLMAQQRNLDLVEVAPEGAPPVCRILNYGKFRYAQRKKEKDALKKQKVIKVKEIKIRPKIDEHDYQTKMRMAYGFFNHGDKVKFTLMFRGREISHKELGKQLIDRVIMELSEIAELETPPKDEGLQIVAIFGPRSLKSGPTKEIIHEKVENNAETKT
jgi:translation initiation factor IF-3